ncbi:MAG: hypothetical protein WDO13_16445 [Verrucomicrobiota bacterium]
MNAPENVAACLDGYEARRRLLLEREALADPVLPPLETMLHSLHGLAYGRNVARGNDQLRRLAEWFESPPSPETNVRDACDFAALKLCRAWHLFPEGSVLEPSTREKIRAFFLRHPFASMYQSENHAFLFHTARYLMARRSRTRPSAPTRGPAANSRRSNATG